MACRQQRGAGGERSRGAGLRARCRACAPVHLIRAAKCHPRPPSTHPPTHPPTLTAQPPPPPSHLPQLRPPPPPHPAIPPATHPPSHTQPHPPTHLDELAGGFVVHDVGHRVGGAQTDFLTRRALVQADLGEQGRAGRTAKQAVTTRGGGVGGAEPVLHMLVRTLLVSRGLPRRAALQPGCCCRAIAACPAAPQLPSIHDAPPCAAPTCVTPMGQAALPMDTPM